jgi:hypothetical protein
MGLLDVLNGMQNGPRGEPQSSVPGSGGMSKTTMALLAFLAYKAYKGLNQPQPAQAGVPAPYPGDQGREPQGAEAGGLAGVLRTIFGGGSVPSSVLSRGVDNTVQDLERSGHVKSRARGLTGVRTDPSHRRSWRPLLGRTASRISCSRQAWSAMICLPR